MPKSAAELENSSFLRLLVLGGPKVGKSTTCITTAPGNGYVINCDQKESLAGAVSLMKERSIPLEKFEWDFCNGKGIFSQLENVLVAARKGIEEKKYSWVLLDTLTLLSKQFEDALLPDIPGEKQADGRKGWYLYERRLASFISRLLVLPAHVVVTAHYQDLGGTLIEGQLEKTGEGIVPLLAGKARGTIPALFQDVVFLEKRAGKRVFVCQDEGVFGPGCRSNLDGVSVVEADIAKLIDRFAGKLK